ncbi:succinylglutamate desuccinylase [Aquimarina sp. M1]
MKTKLKRIIGSYSTGNPGPLLVISAGVHGNEPSGVQAFENVMVVLHKECPEIQGTVIGVYGNKPALAKKQRYIDEDLNRTWTVQNVQKNIKDSVEKNQMFDIIDTLRQYPVADYSNTYFLDCHTTSSDSLPYISVQDTGENIIWAHQFSTHIIKGFSDIVSGCIDHYLSRTGYTGFVFEGGQHDSKNAVLHHEGMIWSVIEASCNLDFEKLSIFPEAVEKIRKYKDQQKTFEIEYRHEIKEGDSFAMQPGFDNFQPVTKGELLAIHNGKKIFSEWDAYIFMPLYQSKGNDGFFIIRSVS